MNYVHLTHRIVALSAVILFMASPAIRAETAILQEDSFVQGHPGYTDRNYGSKPEIRVTSGGPRIGLIQFDLSAISGTVSSATLTLPVVKVVSPATVNIHVIRSSWNENTVTFDTTPSFDAIPIAAVGVASGDVGGTVSLDITSVAQDWIDDPGKNFGLALTTNLGNVHFRSKEGGGGAALDVSTDGVTASDNIAIVALQGGDYTNPLDAVDNAFSGDNWCDRPEHPRPRCRIYVREGVYVIDRTLVLQHGGSSSGLIDLIGVGREATQIVAGPGVDVAIVGQSVSSLSIINTEPSANEKVGIADEDDIGVRGHDLRIKVEGGPTNIGINGSYYESAFLVDSYVEVRGSGGGTSAIGIFGGDLHLTDVEVLARAGGSATGVSRPNEDGGLEITRSTITGGVSTWGGIIRDSIILGSSGSSALSWGGRANLSVYNTEIRATGAGSRGMSLFTEQPEKALFEGVTIWGETAIYVEGYRTSPDGTASTGLRVSITDGRIVADNFALALNSVADCVCLVTIDASILQAPTAIQAGSGNEIRVGAAKLDGSVDPGTSSLTCVFVYDGNYQPLDSSCQ